MVRLILPPPAVGDRSTPEAFTEWEYLNAGTTLRIFHPYGAVQGKSILDLGCGYGGTAVRMAQAGALMVLGIDLQEAKIAQGSRLALRKQISNVDFIRADAGRLPLPADRFDQILLKDFIEHVQDPPRALREVWRVLRPGGLALISFPPYLSPWGGHLFDHLPLPWAHLLLPEAQALNIWKVRQAEAQQRKEGLYSAETTEVLLKAQDVKELRSLNGLSLVDFKAYIQETRFRICLWRARIPFQLRPLSLLWPSLREYLTTRVAAVLYKQ